MMTYRRFFRDLCISMTAILLLLIWTVTNAAAQTADDNAEPGDGEEPAAQSDDSASDGDDVQPTMPALDQMLRIALEHNPDIRAARGEVAVAEANLDRTRLTVVKELTAFRERWLSAKAALAAAEQEMRVAESSYLAGGKIDLVNSAKESVAIRQLQLREIEAELPYLLGASLEDADELAPTSDVESRTGLLRDKAIPLAEQIVVLSVQSFQSGNGDLGRCLEWSSRLMQLQRDVAASDAERDAAVEEYMERLLSMKEVADARYRAGRATQEDVLAAEFAIVEAQIMLGSTPAE